LTTKKNVERNGKSEKGIIIVRRHCVGKSGGESKQANKQTNKQINKEDVHCKIKERKCFLHLEEQKLFCLKSLLRKSFKFYHSGGVQQTMAWSETHFPINNEIHSAKNLHQSHCNLGNGEWKEKIIQDVEVKKNVLQ
jgi:hypothetical protein